MQRQIKLGEVYRAAARVRKNLKGDYLWNVPHLGGGKPIPGLDDGRLFRTIAGGPMTKRQKLHGQRGTLRLVRELVTKQKNHVRQLKARPFEFSPAARTLLEHQIIMMEASTIHLTSVVQILEKEAVNVA